MIRERREKKFPSRPWPTKAIITLAKIRVENRPGNALPLTLARYEREEKVDDEKRKRARRAQRFRNCPELIRHIV